MGSAHRGESAATYALLLASSQVVMATSVLVPVVPSIRARFAGAPNSGFWVPLVLTLPSLLMAVTAPIAGYVVDSAGRKRVLLLSMFLFGMSGVAGYVAPTLAFLLVSRAALGVATGALMTSLTALIADHFSGATRARFLGLQAASMGVAGAASIAVGGMLADIGWRLPFLAYSLSFVVLPVVHFAVREPGHGGRCAEATVPTFGSAQCIAESVRISGSRDDALRSSTHVPVLFLVSAYLTMIAVQAVFFLTPVYLPSQVGDVMGASASQTGLALSLMSLAYALASQQYGRVATRFEYSTVLTAALGLIAGGCVLIWSSSRWAVIVVAALLEGAGIGLFETCLTLWVLNETPAAVRGRAVGGLTSVLFLGRFVASVVGQPMSAVLGSRGLYLGGGVLLLLLALLFSAVPVVLRRVTRRKSSWAEDGNVLTQARRLLGLSRVSTEGQSPPRVPSGASCAERPQFASCSPG